jgi:hypothetical protein
MANTPKKCATQAWLNQQYDDNGWAERLASYTKAEIHNSLTPGNHGQDEGTLTIGNEYYDPNGARVAIIFHYKKPDGTLGGSGKYTPKGLLIEGVWYYC